MKITRLELENWMGIPQLALDFSSGINLVYGRNEIGKSSVIESIRQAILGDASSKKAQYKSLKPWGTDVKAHVNLYFTTGGSEEYRLFKAFPGGGGELYRQGVKVTDDAGKTQRKLFDILDISEKTTNLFRLLFVDQGESLEIFNKKGKDNPLDENTKSYIKDVIKETAFRELQQFKDHLRGTLDQYFTASGKTIKKSSGYFQLLEKEKELTGDLETLRRKEEEFLGKLAEIENADGKIAQLKKEAAEKEAYLESLRKKKTRLDDLDKKRLAFLPVKNDYDNFTRISEELEKLRGRLPVLSATRDRRISDLRDRLKDLEAQKSSAAAQLVKMKLKKREGEKIDARAREFEKIKADYQEVLKLEKQVTLIRGELPGLLAANGRQLETELEAITAKLKAREELEAGFAGIKAQIKGFPKITQKEIKSLRKIENEIRRADDQLKSFSEQLTLSFRLTPGEGKEVPYTLRLDGGAVQQGLTQRPLDISGFRKLNFSYPPGDFGIDVAGSLSETDYDALESGRDANRRELSERMAAFGVESIDSLEEKLDELKKLKNKRDSMQERLAAAEDKGKLAEQGSAVREKLEALRADMEKYTGETLPPSDGPGVGDVRERLTVAKANLDNFRARVEQVLAERQCSLQQLEAEYKKQEEQLKEQRDRYGEMEPKAAAVIDDTALEKEAERLSGFDKGIIDCRNESVLLEDIPSLPQQAGVQGDLPLLTALSSRQLRDDINQAVNRSRELEKQKRELLGERDVEQFSMDYFRRKEELELSVKEIREIPPVQCDTLDKVSAGIGKVEKEVKESIAQMGSSERLRAQLLGETVNFSQVVEERGDREWEYQQVLEDIKGHVSTISSLKLLSRFMDEEQEKAQQEVFRPLQERVVDSFSALVGDRYKIGIDNDLNLEVSGRTFSGEYFDGVDEALSFGTKEQLSFLFRLAIASQLSGREAGVMVLDDSFVNTDLRRLPLLLDILKERAGNLQFLVFTCRPSDYLDNMSAGEENGFRSINLEELMGK